ncbi:amidohydrolase 2 [Rhizorhabdus wittichii RW1]|uniref:Amidohydrolase 2 n=1 Tax=Rhizorhabdus wittichii (strain DSM 6014 / CCUG 31198 / JCM 15750 / NBRC 105917 / EY 4224 / RW1) TaxID=392499 RepID=A0A9J9LEG1_RHIWR|nr:amidohydrolase 2 [Rhizorhabdus wittichii RW1]
MSDGTRAAPGTDGLHVCRKPLPTRPARPRRRAGGAAVVDLHCHFLVAEVEAMAAEAPDAPRPPAAASEAAAATARYNAELIRTTYRPPLTDIDTRLADMDAMGVDVQAISPSPTQYHYWAPADLGEALVARINERIATLCADHPDRLVGLGSVALQHPLLAREQLRHAVRGLGLRGVEISTMVNGDGIDDPRFAPFWEEAERFGALVLVHPLGTTVGPRMDAHYLSNVIGQPLETMIALSRLIMGGHFDRYPALKLCAVHGGGYLPKYAGRSDHGWKVRPECDGCAHPPSAYLRRIWYDSLVYEPAELRALIDAVGADRIVVGTDYPFDMGDYDPIGLVDAVPGLGAADKAAILGGNARKLLGIAGPGLRKE